MAAYTWIVSLRSVTFTPDGGEAVALKHVSQAGETERELYRSADPAAGSNLPDPDNMVTRVAHDVAVLSSDLGGHDNIDAGDVGTLVVVRDLENDATHTTETVTYTKMEARIKDNIIVPGQPQGRVAIGRRFTACHGHTRTAVRS